MVLDRRLLILCIMSYTLPLVFVFTAIALSGWFNFVENALSDLGHAVKSNVAPVFNFGLALGGFMIGLLAYHYMWAYDRVRGAILVYTGFTLVLIGVFDEVYGLLHFIVSILFFLGIIAYLLVEGFIEKNLAPVVVAILQVIIWYLHLVHNIPPGAAIPELIAVSSYIPFYTLDYMKITGSEDHNV
jgi:hypothetical membrane protein